MITTGFHIESGKSSLNDLKSIVMKLTDATLWEITAVVPNAFVLHCLFRSIHSPFLSGRRVQSKCLLRFKMFNSFTVHSISVGSCYVLRASTEVDAGDKGGNKTDVSPVFL